MNLSLATWNVNGIRACVKKGFLDVVESLGVDLLCLQEVRAKVDQLPKELSGLDGYEAHWFPAERPGYSGVGCLTKKKPDKVIDGIGVEEFDVEGRTQQIVFEDIVVINSYVPNGGRDLSRVDYKLRYYEHLLKQSQVWESEGKGVVMTGDWNTCHQPIDLARPKGNVKNTGFLPEEREWISRMISSGYGDAFREEYPEKEGAYSWWSQRGGAREKNVGWRLDYFLVSPNLKSRSGSNQIHPDLLGSDHCPVSMVIE
jgi:exodeoxyribonuclease III